ncbi:unnamed protein product [Durusdinium trenchii]|uniref:Uncharacterized protein n=1 Tax=Durusdinium trenchii TaxID=1381693 RepID=A0ABP0JUM1_9DINO
MEATPMRWATGADSTAQVERHHQTLRWIAQTYSQIQNQFPGDLHEEGAERLRKTLCWLVEQCEEVDAHAKGLLARTSDSRTLLNLHSEQTEQTQDTRQFHLHAQVLLLGIEDAAEMSPSSSSSGI